MALSMTSPIRAADILEIEMFKELKVFRLRGLGGDDLVIKTDAVFANQIKSAGLVVKAVDSGVKMKIITASEMQELSDYIKVYEEVDAYYESMGFTSRFQSQKEAIKALKQSLTFGFPFCKMEMQRIHHLEEAINKRGEGNKDIVRLIVSNLKADGGLEAMGRVVAGDLFNGNTDRFFPGSGSTKEFGPFTVKLKALVNPGNAMLIATQNGFQATMLDYVDPQSRFKDINASLADLEDPQVRWPGRTLVDKKARTKFADDIASDLETMLHPKKSFFSLKTKLGGDAAKRLDRGMVEGARLIKAGLEAKYNPNRWTAGAKERYQLMCQVRA